MADLVVTLSEEDWGKALNAIADGPFKQVAPLIQNIQKQLQMQLDQRQRDQSPMPNVPKANGSIEQHAPGA